MLRRNISIVFRNLTRNKVYGLINIIGLALGLAVFIMIMLWVANETSYNKFHKDSDRIEAMMVNRKVGNDISTFPACPTLLAGTLKKDLPGIEYASRVTWGDVRSIAYNDKSFSENGLYVDPDFLKIFSFPLLKGNINNVLKDPNTILISETLAKKYFGGEDPVGKTIVVEQSTPYKIEGVVKDVPANSTIRFDFLMPFGDYMKNYAGGTENWSQNNIKTYVKLNAAADKSKMNAAIKDFMQRYTDQQQSTTLFFWDLKDWYLRNDFKNGVYSGGGRISYVNLFIIIAIFILVLACINFMNLSTARATQRAKEVAVRKTAGVARLSLIFQFIGESVLLSILAGIIALALVVAVLPYFNDFLNKQISIDFTSPANLLIYAAIILITGLLAGSYPAFVLSSFKPSKVLKSVHDHAPGSAVWVRKALVVLQFSVSVMLIIGTTVVYNQVNYIRNKNLGYNRENLVWFPNNIAAERTETALREFSQVPGVESVARASMTFTSSNNRGTEVNWPGKKEGDEVLFSFITGDHNIIQTMDISMKEGRAFSKDYATDTAAFIVNEEAVKRMGLRDPIGQTIETYGGKGTIVGVAKDFHIESMHSPVPPVIIECHPDWTWLYYVRIDGKNVQQTLSGLEDVYKKMAPGFTFDYSFQDKEYERTFKSEMQIGTLVNYFAFFAIFISCLGLLGLTTFTVERRTREIGIRKVLGASVVGIVSMISKQFIGLIALSVLIAIIPSWYFMNEWLQDYTYRTELSWWVFAAAGCAVLIIALVTISFMAVKAALDNPVKSLRTE